MFKKIFKKPEEEAKPSAGINVRPKIVIKKRTPSNAPIPSSIANTISANPIPRPAPPEENIPQETEYYEEEDHTPAEADTQEQEYQEEVNHEKVPTVEPRRVEQIPFDTSLYDEKIAELESSNQAFQDANNAFQVANNELQDANLALQEKTDKLTQENRSLHVEIVGLEKETTKEISELKEALSTQKNNYVALEDQFLLLKDDFDAVKLDYEQLDEDYNTVSADFEDLQSISVPKADLQHIQSKLREETMRKNDLESQVGALKKDTTRYEGMVSELSSHITELKDSFEKGAEEQHQKLMEVKDSELERLQEHHEEITKQLNELKTEKKKLQKVINEKDSLIDQNQGFEEKWIEASDKVSELLEELNKVDAEKLVVEDKLALLESDMSGYGTNVKNFEKTIDELNALRTSQVESIKEQKKKISNLVKEQAFLEDKLAQTEKLTESSKDEIQKITTAHEVEISEKDKEIETLQVGLKLKIEELDLVKTNLASTNSQADESVAKIAELEAIKLLAEKEKSRLSDKLNEKQEENTSLEKEIIGLQQQLESLQQDTSLEDATKSLTEIQGKYNGLLKIEENLMSEITKLQGSIESVKADKKALADESGKKGVELEKMKIEIKSLENELNILKEDNTASETEKQLSDVQNTVTKLEKALAVANENLEKSSKELAIETEITKKLTAEIEELKKNTEESKSAGESVSKDETSKLKKELKSLQKSLDKSKEVEKAQLSSIESLQGEKAQLIEQIEALNNAEGTVESSSEEVINYSINLVMKPEGDEYDLELPGNMNGAEIKAELTDAGLLTEGGSYDLYLPRVDKYIMNDEMLSSGNIEQGETLEIITA